MNKFRKSNIQKEKTRKVFSTLLPSVAFLFSSCSWLPATTQGSSLPKPINLLLQSQDPINGIGRIEVSPDGKEITLVNNQHPFQVWGKQNGRAVHSLSINGGKNSIANASFTPDGKSILVGEFDDRSLHTLLLEKQ